MKNGANKFAGVRVLIFDLDGTLIDSKLDLALAVNATRENCGLSSLEHELIYSYVGNGAPALIRLALSEGVGEEGIEEGLKFFLQYYRAHMLDNTVLYPGVREGLELLAGREMAVLTNKPVRFSEAIIEGLGIAQYFRFIYGGNSFERKKPDPMGVEVLLRDLRARPEEAMMVGDSEVDVKTARSAGIWACGVSYGLGSERLVEFPPDLMVDSLLELPAHFDGTALREA